jgi:hypothetical protein
MEVDEDYYIGMITAPRERRLFRRKHDAEWEIKPAAGTEFFWGYEGMGPAHLAFALLKEITSIEEALDLRAAFMREVVSRAPKDRSFLIQRAVLVAWLRRARERAVEAISGGESDDE